MNDRRHYVTSGLKSSQKSRNEGENLLDSSLLTFFLCFCISRLAILCSETLGSSFPWSGWELLSGTGSLLAQAWKTKTNIYSILPNSKERRAFLGRRTTDIQYVPYPGTRNLLASNIFQKGEQST